MILLKLAIALLLLSSARAAVGVETKLVKEVCEKTAHVPYNDCVQALVNDFRTENITDIKALALLSLDLARANSSEAVGYVTGIAENSPAALKAVLDSCSGWLFRSQNDFRVAVGDLMEDPKYGNYDAFIAMDGPTNCRQAMKDANVSIPAVSVRCGHVELFSRICYTTTEMVEKTGA